jgi:hypothetical protein
MQGLVAIVCSENLVPCELVASKAHDNDDGSVTILFLKPILD